MILLLRYDFSICWFIDLEDIPCASYLVIDQFSYGERVIMNDFIDIGEYITCSEFYDSYWSIWFIDDLEDVYIDDFKDMSWLYTLPRLFYSW